MSKILSLVVCLLACLSALAQTIQPSGSTTFCQGGNVELKVTGAPGSSTYSWEVSTNAGGSWSPISGQTNNSYTATTTGSYRVIVTSGGTPTTVAPVDVVVNPKPGVDFTFTNDNACSGTPIQFTPVGITGTAPFTYTWNFDDGATSSDQNPTHSFSSLGCGTITYRVSLTVTDANNCSNTVIKQVTVKQLPEISVSDIQNRFNPFSNCVNSPSASKPTFTVKISNTSSSCITDFTVNWGDGTVQNGLTASSFPLTHTYATLGTFDLVVTGRSSNGCTNSKTYTVINQSNPAVGISAPGSTSGCAPEGFWFKLSRYELNSPGTIYEWDFGDGSPKVTWTTPVLVDSIFHQFTRTSCNELSKQFIVKVKAINGCNSTTATVDNITIFEKPKAGFNMPASACANQSVFFSNTSVAGYNPGNCNRTVFYEWDFGDGTTSTLENPSHVYTTAGTYTVKLKASGQCGDDIIQKQICITTAATAGFSLDNTTGCAPMTVTATNTSSTIGGCATTGYNWSIAFSPTNCGTTTGASFASGSSASSIHPSFTFTKPGTYTITLSVAATCGTVTTSKTVVVKSPPAVSLNAIPNACGPVSITPTATVTNCGSAALTYAWTFEGGTPATSTNANPGLVSFSTPGAHTVTLAVTNECGTTTVSRTFTIGQAPGITTPSAQSFCPGVTAASFNVAGTTPSTTYSWTNSNTAIGLAASGSGSTIPSFTTQNNGTLPISGVINVSASSNGCTSTSTFTITVNPRPAAPSVTTPIPYCQSAPAEPLKAIASAEHVLNWYTSPTGGTPTSTPFTPSTATVGNTTYYVSQTNTTTGCEGPRASIVVSVRAIPVIGNSTSTNPTGCTTATGSISLNGLTPYTSYSVNYTKDGAPVTVTLQANYNGVITIGSLNAGTYDNISVTLNGCTSNTAGPFSLSDPNPPSTPTAGSNSPLCSGATLNLTASSTTPGVSYTWSGPNGYTSSQQNPTIPNATTAASGTYNVTARLNGCTSVAGSVTVTVNQKPLIPTISSNSPQCSGGTLSLTASTSTPGVTYSWTGPSGFTSSEQNPTIPSITTAASGTYSVVATATQGGCTSAAASTQVMVRPTPVIGGASATNPSTCASSTGTIVLNGLTASTSYTVNYTRNGASVTVPVTTNASGLLTISGLSAGTYDNISVTLNSCSSNKVGPFTLADPTPPPTPVVSSNSPICSGATLSLTSSTSATGTVLYAWTGPNGFTSPAQNPTIANVSTSASGTYTVTVSVNGCTSRASLPVTINSKPSKPVVTTPVIYCQNSTPSTLTVSGVSDNTFTWYDNMALTNGSTTAPLPSTATPRSTLYYVTQTNADGCVSDTSSITVTVYPALANNVIGSDQTICSGAIPAPLGGTAMMSGGTGTFTYQWEQSVDDGTTWSAITGAVSASYSPVALSVDTRYRRKVSSGPCSSSISNEVKITVQGQLANYDIAAAQTICVGDIPQPLTGQQPTGGSGSYLYQWQQLSSSGTWSDIPGATAKDYAPPALTATTQFRRKVVSGTCSMLSAPVTVTVRPKLVMTPISDGVYCTDATVATPAFSSTPAGSVTYSWTNDQPSIGLAGSGSGTLPSFVATNNQTPKVPVVATITVVPSYSGAAPSCPGDATTFTITVLPTLTLSAVPDQVVCTGAVVPALTPAHDGDPAGSGSVGYSWTVSGQGITLANGSGVQIPSFTAVNNGSTDLVATITITPAYTFKGKTCSGVPLSYKVTVKPGTPNADAGSDATLCAEESYTMKAVLPTSATGRWEQIGSPAVTIVDPTSPTTLINGLQAGQTYEFRWTVTGFASCPPTTDVVTIVNHNDLVNEIDRTGKTICEGQSVTISGELPAGGNGTYQYLWQVSTDGSSWTTISGATGQSLTYTPAGSVYVRRIVTSTPCISESLPVQIIVQPGVSNNTISADQTICTGTAAAPLTGSKPAGGDNQYFFQWEKSTDGGTSWTLIAGATDASYDPGVLTQTIKYRRRVATNLCSGPQQNTSNVVTVTVNPDAKAVFTYTTDIACAPFVLNASIIELQLYPDRNSIYEWYADGTLIGTGSSFPGYTINGSGQSTVIKLKAISRFGCKNDSMEHVFSTVVEPQPNFTLSTDEGCGPLTVALTNTTSDASRFTYQWSFGNGQTSTAVKPGPITFLPNPSYGDTVYTVKLEARSSCKTIEVTRPVRVKSGPKALFAPSSTLGCSPMTVTFNNTSLGNGNAYTWDFGDGTTVVSSAGGQVSHTFFTAVRDTFYVKLMATNECGRDSLRYAIVVSPNAVKLDFALNGDEQLGCAPHAVRFFNNTKGATTFRWDLGDGNVLSTTKNVDTVAHTYAAPGTYVVRLMASNGCSDTSTTETITVFPKPRANFTASQYTACLGDTVRFANSSDSATSYLWIFGDGNSSTLVNPQHIYRAAGTYTVVLHTFRVNAPGNICSDSATTTVQVMASRPGTFTTSGNQGSCAPFTVTFRNTHVPSVSTLWDFGDGTTGTGDLVTHTYTTAGTFPVKMTTTVPGGCTYESEQTVTVKGPSGELLYTGGLLCNAQAARLEAKVTNTDMLVWNFGDGTTLRTTQRVVYHTYAQGGAYLPSVTLESSTGCSFPLAGRDTIKVDKIEGGFTASQEALCGATNVVFSDTSHAFYGKASVSWRFGDGATGSGPKVTHTYTTSGTYNIEVIVVGASGCADTLSRPVTVVVNAMPTVNIIADPTSCDNRAVTLKANIVSADAVGLLQWTLSNGTRSNSNPLALTLQPGDYTATVVVGTDKGCYDTAVHNLSIYPSPSITASEDVTLCRGASTQLSVSGAQQYVWTPLQALSCTTCPQPVASPLQTTPYVVKGINSYGCYDEDTVVVRVIQPLEITVSKDDSICVGGSAPLMASGATTYSWSPAEGLSSTTASNPVATPVLTTRYRVVGYDGFNCFTDTAYVLVAVGGYPTVDLGPDQTLATGTMLPLRSVIQNGPIRKWEWSPATNLSCASCPEPRAEVKKDIAYSVTVTSAYGCSATDTVHIKAFCENTQVFVPNAFTPDADGINDVLMVRGSGIVTVKSFRVFNRWGEVIFERSNFPPNNPTYGWDGRIRGVVSGPDVFVYTAEVVCENGVPYTYKGNVSILK